MEFVETVDELLGKDAPEEYDLKRIMKGYYERYEKNCKKKLAECVYQEMLADMPYENGEKRPIINYLKYKNADTRRLGNKLTLFDCDGSNGSCDLSLDMYRVLWGWKGRKCPLPLSETHDRLRRVSFGPDTMNTAATSLNRFAEAYKRVAGCSEKSSVSRLYDKIVLDQDSKFFAESGDSEALAEELDGIFGSLLETSGMIGNLVLVPSGFNSWRGTALGDDWDRSLELLREGGERLDKVLTADGAEMTKWDRDLFPEYVNLMFLWDYVQVNEGELSVLPLWNDARDDYRGFSEEVARRIRRRGIFMAGMLKIAVGNSFGGTDFYHKIVDRVLTGSSRVYSGYGEVLEEIGRLAERENASDEIDQILCEIRAKLNGNQNC